ncbi:MAG: biotin--[acetyl-CoA-carboxylase] ligase [Tissierellia bacterium]|nr:biotin--[acetyl-CoA-carboxylase] ligase [Tissierellia bacterium]
MTVKNKVLHILESNKGKYISGQNLADLLLVSRTAIWKAIKSLKDEGYPISSAANKGYILSPDSDLLSSEGIRLHLREEFKTIPISFYKSIESTNSEAKLIAVQQAEHGTVIVAEEQTKGRGRFGRDFFSPADSGIYMSIIIKPELNIENSVLVTTAAAVAVCRAIEKLTYQVAKIKWVNDIFVNDKKVCGILTEAVTNFESGMMDSVIVGIGINVKTKKEVFPVELQTTAGSILSHKDNSIRNQLAAEIINNLLIISKNLEERKFLEEYKERSMILNEHILYSKDNQWHKGYAIDIDEYGGLVIFTADKQKITLNSGEVSIRKK